MNPRQDNSELGITRTGVYLTELEFSEHAWKETGSQQKTEMRSTTWNQKQRQ